METPSITMMASGNLSLLITEAVTWESFPEQAQRFVDRFQGRVLKRTDTPVERIWEVEIDGCPFWLTFEDFPLGLSLDSMNSLCNPVIQKIHGALAAVA